MFRVDRLVPRRLPGCPTTVRHRSLFMGQESSRAEAHQGTICSRVLYRGKSLALDSVHLLIFLCLPGWRGRNSFTSRVSLSWYGVLRIFFFDSISHQGGTVVQEGSRSRR